jgi:hypothetical protein
MLVPILLSAIVAAVCAITIGAIDLLTRPDHVYVTSRYCPAVEFQPMQGAGFGGRSVEP